MFFIKLRSTINLKRKGYCENQPGGPVIVEIFLRGNMKERDDKFGNSTKQVHCHDNGEGLYCWLWERLGLYHKAQLVGEASDKM